MNKYLYKIIEIYYIVTFIGTVIHEFAHEQAVLSRNLEVEEVDYFSLSGSSLGYVKHENPRTYVDMFVIGLAPLLVNTIVSLCAFVGVFIVYSSTTPEPIVRYGSMVVLLWLGLSSSLHSFPSSTDVKNIINVKKILWGMSEPQVKEKLTVELKDTSDLKNILISVFTLPLWLLTNIFHGLKYIIFNPVSAVTVPFIYGLYSTLYLKYVGLHLFYTVGLLYLAQELYILGGF